MSLPFVWILVATIAQFACGALWYTVLFGRLWGKIHGFEKYSREEQKKMASGMAPFYAIQLFVTFVTTSVLALFINGFPSEWNVFGIAGFTWIGFVVPTQASAVIFGGTEPRWIVKKIAVMAGASLLCLLVAAAILKMA
jgi:uncharacterized membrane protein